LDVPDFKNLNPTAENIAVVIWNKLRAEIPNQFKLSIRLYETENNIVEYDGQ
jgi:6-pyruvoyltetrahydropterin/6-carboxytetrahydropterin synthase